MEAVNSVTGIVTETRAGSTRNTLAIGGAEDSCDSCSMKDESGAPAPSGEPSHRGYDSRPIPDRLLAIFLAVLVVALVLGYLFLNKLVDISSQEDCVLAHRRNCAASESDR
jgi:hypothetical protein